jgi:hypothetical protein
MRRTFTILLLALLALAIASAAYARAGRATLGPWKAWWGQTSTGGGLFKLSSQPPTSPAETHSALLTSAGTWGDQTFTYTETTLKQLRLGSPPNTWEVAWSMFRFRDLSNYYYFILKPNGYELGKKQGSDAQIFLATGSAPRLQLGTSYRIQIRAVAARIRVSVNGTQVLDFTDPHPLPAGSVGLYEEDSQVQFSSVAVSS